MRGEEVPPVSNVDKMRMGGEEGGETDPVQKGRRNRNRDAPRNEELSFWPKSGRGNRLGVAGERLDDLTALDVVKLEDLVVPARNDLVLHTPKSRRYTEMNFSRVKGVEAIRRPYEETFKQQSSLPSRSSPI
jgi:hypothetical protein